jgi:hypothetical protein
VAVGLELGEAGAADGEGVEVSAVDGLLAVEALVDGGGGWRVRARWTTSTRSWRVQLWRSALVPLRVSSSAASVAPQWGQLPSSSG